MGTAPAATSAAAPPDDPPTTRSRFHGFRVGPLATEVVFQWRVNSGVAVRPMIASPARLKRLTISLSSRGT
jgi:hypothetical protein